MAVKYDRELKLILLGESGTGKTSLCQYILNKKGTAPTAPTIGVAYSRLFVGLPEHDKYTGADVALWDTAGTEKYRSIVPAYSRDASGALVVYDVTSRQSFERVTYWLDSCINGASEAVRTCSCLLGNKADKPPGERQVSYEEGAALAERYGMAFAETSAYTGAGVDDALVAMVEKILQLVPTRPRSTVPPASSSGNVRISRHVPTETVESSGCC